MMDAKIALWIALGALLGGTLHWASAGFAAPTSPETTSCGCMDLADNRTINHLAHHPGEFGKCVKLVDPAEFRTATNQEKEQYLRENKIQ